MSPGNPLILTTESQTSRSPGTKTFVLVFRRRLLLSSSVWQMFRFYRAWSFSQSASVGVGHGALENADFF